MPIGTDVLVVDVETVSDTELARHEDLYGADGEEKFAALPFQKIVAIAFAHARLVSEDDGRRVNFVDCRAGLDETATERDLLRGFWTLVGRLQPTIVTWNGRGFDVPVLLWRSMKWRVAAPAWFRKNSNFENYMYRFSPDWHADLMDIMTVYGAARKLSVDAAARAVGAPGKLGVDGSQIRDMVAAGRLADVRAYCETDVLNTYLVWLSWRHLMGDLSNQELDHAHSDLATWLEKERALRPHLGDFFSIWRLAGSLIDTSPEALRSDTSVGGAVGADE